jgi:hypothetical protein
MARTKTVTYFVGESSLCVAQGAFAITFYRPATNPDSGAASNPVKIDGVPIAAGGTFEVKQNVGDTDVTQYDVVFGAGAGENILYVIQILPSVN